MQKYELLLTSGSFLAAVAVCVNVFLTRKKIQARTHLLQHLKDDSCFLSETERLHEMQQGDLNAIKKEMERIRAIIEKQLEDLDPDDRRRVESSLYQTSQIGRMRYLESLAQDAKKLHYAEREMAHSG